MKALLVLWAAVGAAHAAPIDAEVAQVIDLFYDLRSEEALKAAAALEARHPGHPAGPFYRSIVYYQRFLAEEPKSEATLDAFMAGSAEASAAAKALSRSDPAQGRYYLGIAHGFRARVLSAQKRYFRALPEALRAIHHLKEALALDPGIEDAYMGLGMYHYYLARLPPGARPFTRMLIGLSGDRDLGLAELERTAQRGSAARWEARSVLSAIYSSEREGQWDKAEPALAELMTRYPHNPLYRLRRVYVAERREAWGEALALADPAGRWVQGLESGLRPIALAAARYRAAECLLLSARAREAQPLLDALAAGWQPESLRDWTALRRGNLLDALGRRAEAAAAYRSVKEKRASPLAEEFLKTPFPAGPRRVMPWRGLETPP